MKAIGEDIFAETEFPGCNVGFVNTPEGIAMIDTPMRPSHAIKWKEEISRRGEIIYLINTEHHIDHVFGNFFFPTTIISHQGTREQIPKAIAPIIAQFKEGLKRTDPAGLSFLDGYELRLPSITFDRNLDVYIGKYILELINLPGHVPNQVMVRIPQAGVLFASDNVFNGLYPWFHECLALSWLETLKEIDQMDIETIVPGHGEVCTKEAIPILSDYIEEVIEEVRSAIRQGWTREETATRASFPPPFPVEPGLEERLPGLHRLGIMRIYDQLSS